MARLNDVTVQTLTIPKKDMLMHVLDQDDGLDKNIEYQNVMYPLNAAGPPASTPEFLNQEYIDTTANRRYFAKGTATSADWTFNKPISGAGAPGVTPLFVGQIYIDTTGNREYYAIATSTSADWRKVCICRYGTVTIVAGSGDVTVNLDFDWTGGMLFVFRSLAAASYFDNGTSTLIIETTYDSITNGSYTNHHNMAHSDVATYHVSAAKTLGLIGNPKSATATSFTLDDQAASDCYIKWLILA